MFYFDWQLQMYQTTDSGGEDNKLEIALSVARLTVVGVCIK